MLNAIRKVTDDLYFVGANDHRLELFENIHPIPQGVSYNSYLMMDEKTALFDTVDWSVTRTLLENILEVLDGRDLDYLIINHMEPDHCGSIEEILIRYPEVTVVATEKAFDYMRQLRIRSIDNHKTMIVKEGDSLSLGKHNIVFVEAPMVHWPEAMVSFDTTDGILFSADAFGSFIALDGVLFADEVDFDRDWIDEARRYYTNIVGKYGPFVQALLKKAATIDIKIICPLHGPVWRENLGYILEKYDKWSKYEPEEKGVLIPYASMYGNTEQVAQVIASKLYEKGVRNVAVYDVSNTDTSYLISEAFRLSHMILCSVTYNLNIYPKMEYFLREMKLLNLQNRTVAIVENGSWAPQSGDLMEKFLDDEMRMVDVLNERVTLNSALSEGNLTDIDSLVEAVVDSINND
ncbi:FprA family A-type flavoprotein [Anaerosphaera multitolerans]|uniref:FprA family A-type flavoprotein n=1 Tax=Anaerosphaera multitolerans TaxID=2487351 RepID=A0A437S464_9FIRM|nr:FprA family A-type flavoprotein [Anaerosphaera multitolerans]RVU53825.1 FprA family A-type flavoprotein [Anaerosphaera multitolerans]